MTKIILAIPPFLHDRGTSLDVESDIFYHFKSSIKKTGKDYQIINFDNNDEKLSLNFKNFEETAKSNKQAIFIFDANNNPNDKTGIYPKELEVLINKHNLFCISFIPDLIKSINLEFWVKNSKFLISPSQAGVNWANKFYMTNKFKFYPSIPVEKSNNYTLEDLKKRPFDFGYIGSNKIFRLNFISSLLKLGGNRFSSLIISSYRSSSFLKQTKQYMNLLTECKFYFCTRASLYEKGDSLFFIKKGRYAGRISEAIASGCIPIYWQPSVKNIFKFAVNYFFLYSKFSKFFSFLKINNNTDTGPFDIETPEDFCIKINSASQLLKIIKEKNYKLIKKIQDRNNIIYNKYINPDAFFDFIEKLKNEI
jgi:hypothetical protein